MVPRQEKGVLKRKCSSTRARERKKRDLSKSWPWISTKLRASRTCRKPLKKTVNVRCSVGGLKEVKGGRIFINVWNRGEQIKNISNMLGEQKRRTLLQEKSEGGGGGKESVPQYTNKGSRRGSTRTQGAVGGGLQHTVCGNFPGRQKLGTRCRGARARKNGGEKISKKDVGVGGDRKT